MPTAIDIGTLITHTPGIIGGRARLAGSRMPVQVIGICNEFHGYSPEKILEEYSHLTMPQIYAALAYYYANRDEMQADMDRDDAAEREFLVAHPPQR